MKNRNGFMLVQVLVASGIMSIIALAMSGLMKDFWTETSSIQTKNNEILLGQALRQQTTDPTLCRQSLVNVTSFNGTATERDLEIKLNTADAPADAVKATKDMPSWGLTVESLKLTNLQRTLVLPTGVNIYIGDMELKAAGTAGRKMSYKTKNLGKLFLEVTGSNITGCYGAQSESGIAKYTCESLGATFNEATQTCNSKRILAGVGQCSSSQVMKGFDSSGNIVCGVPPVPPPTPTVVPTAGPSRTCGFQKRICGNQSTDVGAGCCGSAGGSCSKIASVRVTCSHSSSNTVYGYDNGYLCTCN